MMGRTGNHKDRIMSFRLPSHIAAAIEAESYVTNINPDKLLTRLLQDYFGYEDGDKTVLISNSTLKNSQENAESRKTSRS